MQTSSNRAAPTRALTASAVLAAVALAATPAQAALVTYDIGLTVDSGPLGGQAFGGQFSFDDAQLPGTNLFGDTTYALSSFSFTFGGQAWSLADVAAGSALLWTLPAFGGPAGLDGVFNLFSFVPGGGFDPFFTYDFGQGGAGTGALAYTLADAGTLPEPAGLALVCAALLALAAARRARRGR